MTGGVIGTAGHIDHGKTALVRALTGVDTDRLPEEKQRGITIDLGFTHLSLEPGVFSVVDVPGHEDFVRNMVAGATGIDVLLLAVAADEGVMPQTREHLAIARLLAVPRAVVALTKADLVDPDFLELAADDVANLLADSPYAGAPVIATSATTGEGIATLAAALAGAADGRGRVGGDLFRMPVDRAFTVRGTGTVVTGTIWSGAVDRDRPLRILPGGLTARVRGIEVHGAAAERAVAGQRAAVALTGIERDAVPRGTTIVAGPGWAETRRLTAQLTVLPGPGWEIEHGQRLRVHLGTAEVMARAYLVDGDRIAPGDAGWAELRLEAPIVARARDRLVVRSFSPVTTIGGGIVAEPGTPARRRRAAREAVPAFEAVIGDDDARGVAAVVERAGLGGAPADRLPLDTGRAPDVVARALADAGAVRAGDRLFGTGHARQVAEALLAAVDDHHRRWPIRAGIEAAALRLSAPPGSDDALVDHALDALLAGGDLVMREGRVARPRHQPTLSPEQAAARDRILRTYIEAAAQPPRTSELADAVGPVPEMADLLAMLEAEGELVRIGEDLLIHGPEIRRIAELVRDRFGGREDVSPAEVRDLLGISRRHLIPILEHLDRTGVTRRQGDGRVVA